LACLQRMHFRSRCTFSVHCKKHRPDHDASVAPVRLVWSSWRSYQGVETVSDAATIDVSSDDLTAVVDPIDFGAFPAAVPSETDMAVTLPGANKPVLEGACAEAAAV
jgi:hypothetical protein